MSTRWEVETARGAGSAHHAPTDTATPAVQVEGLTKAYGRVRAVDGLSFAVRPGHILALLGPSGCGKTTALRLIAGLERPDAGRVLLDGQVVADARTFVPPERRRVGMVFQDYALFPHLRVADNIGFGLPRGPARAQRIEALLAQVGLAGLGHRWPHELSGGQQQRVALARALAPQPRLLLLDEPFSNLDAALRARVRAEVRAILRDAGVTAIFVTHDRDEALSLADEVAVVTAGRILQRAAPEELYRFPASPAVAQAVGDADFLEGVAAGDLATCALGRVPLARPVEGPVMLLFRPEDLVLEADADGPGIIAAREFYGHDQVVTVRLPTGAELRVRLRPDAPATLHQRVRLRPRGPVVAFPRT
ncbi:MAG TPA: ABC transporter ATP-binding protein [Chloroflexota bacterium]|jgi:iron(III) transport system ATP-binding protein|nr:ABC transporter ATP-binding protein [Chloroflexota bacterium]